MKKTIRLSVLLILLMLTFTACGQGSDSAPADTDNAAVQDTSSLAEPANDDPSKVMLNKTYTAGTLEYTITHVRALSSGRMTPAAGNYFIIIGVDIKNTGSEDFETIYSGPIATSQFSFKDAAGTSIYVIGGTGDTDGQFEAEKSIEAGKSSYGELMYEVPASESSFYLTICDEESNDSETIEIEAVKPQ